ncbi:hypothetical protein [Bdellovibrio reynosensis]|uniref:Uncharacterized protein n=1 Tax=Bdellovibrio reynosensis TaxID=2835041 RepID=A0ABY4CF25_9BACT|nr:hypothetical protein [Bdellovibrio reynosensis]UOF02266.1 hypothetical protein MNR06_04795 [Bdellovibrio reynosensis]
MEKIKILSNVSDERRNPGEVEVEYFSPRQRTQVALKKLFLFWGIALVSVLIPIFHFVTVPLFFGLGLFFAYRSYQSQGQVLSGETHCPHCQNKIVVQKAELQWPISEICQNCARVVRIEPANESK